METNKKRATESNQVVCRGGHEVEQGKSVNEKGWCNLCLKDMGSHRRAGETAKARGLRAVW